MGRDLGVSVYKRYMTAYSYRTYVAVKFGWVSRKLISFDCSRPSHESQLDGRKPVTLQRPALHLCVVIFLFIVLFANLK